MAQRWAKRTNRDRSGVTPTPPHPMTHMPRADLRPHGPRAQSPSRAHTAHSRALPRVTQGRAPTARLRQPEAVEARGRPGDDVTDDVTTDRRPSTMRGQTRTKRTNFA